MQVGTDTRQCGSITIAFLLGFEIDSVLVIPKLWKENDSKQQMDTVPIWRRVSNVQVGSFAEECLPTVNLNDGPTMKELSSKTHVR